MSKTCNQCQQLYKGFGSTCAACRRAPAEAAAAASPKRDSAAPDHCAACNKRVYEMEKKCVEGLLFHKTCFKCTTCGCKLDCAFGKNELGFFCMTHFHQIVKVTGGYKTGTGPTRNAIAAGLVDAMVNRKAKADASGEAAVLVAIPAEDGSATTTMAMDPSAAVGEAASTPPAEVIPVHESNEPLDTPVASQYEEEEEVPEERVNLVEASRAGDIPTLLTGLGSPCTKAAGLMVPNLMDAQSPI